MNKIGNIKLDNKKMIEAVTYIVGCLILSVSINMFLVPNTISTGGATGVGIVLYSLLKIPVSVTVLLINIPLFVIALKNFGMKFCIKALIGTALLVIFLQLTSFLSTLEMVDVTSDVLLSSIAGGVLSGIGLALVFKVGGSTGGTDLLAQIIYKKRQISSIGQVLLILDTIIILGTMLSTKNLFVGLYSVVAIYVSKKVIDVVFEGVNYTKVINIITQNGEEISKKIIEKIGRGVTSYKCIGKYTNQKYDFLVTVVTKPQLSTVKQIIKKIDSSSFIYICSANEVLGTGFEKVSQ